MTSMCFESAAGIRLRSMELRGENQGMSGAVTGNTDFDGFITVVASDIEVAMAVVRGESTTQARRAAVRAIFAGAEAIVWYAKNLTCQAISPDRPSYSPLELLALKDESFTVKENGEVAPKVNIVPLIVSMKLVSKLLRRNQRSDLDLAIDGEALSTLTAALKVRHRLTHPRRVSDLDVSVQEFSGSVASWAIVLTFALNVSMEADKRMGTNLFPVSEAEMDARRNRRGR